MEKEVAAVAEEEAVFGETGMDGGSKSLPLVNLICLANLHSYDSFCFVCRKKKSLVSYFRRSENISVGGMSHKKMKEEELNTMIKIKEFQVRL